MSPIPRTTLAFHDVATLRAWRRRHRGTEEIDNYFALSFFSDKGIQFYLPAYLLAGLEGDDETFTRVVYHLDTFERRSGTAGATSLQEPRDRFYGHRVARVQDPSGNQWSIHTVVEDVSQEGDGAADGRDVERLLRHPLGDPLRRALA